MQEYPWSLREWDTAEKDAMKSFFKTAKKEMNFGKYSGMQAKN